MTAKRLIDIHFVLKRAPATQPCSHGKCRHKVMAGQVSACIITRRRYSYQPAKEAYRCATCTMGTINRHAAAERQAARRRARAKV